jgi:flagellar basal-body rod protein FlgB
MVRHNAIATNIANAETPHYQRVDLAPSFRAELQSAIAARDTNRLSSLRPQIAKDARALPVNRDGNTVNLERELVELSQNTLEGTIQSRLVTSSLAKLRMAITGKS